MSPQKLTGEVVGENEKILLYGESGAGKTHAGGTMPAPVYFICIGGENELKTLRGRNFVEANPEKADQIYYDSVEEPKSSRGRFDEADAFDLAGDMIDEALEADRKGDIHFESIVVDNVTSLRSVQMNKAIEFNYYRTQDKDKTAFRRLFDENILVPGDNDWQSQMSLMKQFMSWMFDIDKHVLVTAHEWTQTKTNRQDHSKTIQARRPHFTGNNRTEIPLMFDNVWWLHTEGGGRSQVRAVQTVECDITLAKTRVGGAFGSEVRDPDMERMIRRMQEDAREVAEEYGLDQTEEVPA